MESNLRKLFEKVEKQGNSVGFLFSFFKGLETKKTTFKKTGNI